MIRVEEERLLRASGALRRKVEECRRLARDVKIRLLHDEMQLQGKGHAAIVRILGERFGLSRTQVKRVIRDHRPPAKGGQPPTPPSRPEAVRERYAPGTQR